MYTQTVRTAIQETTAELNENCPAVWAIQIKWLLCGKSVLDAYIQICLPHDIASVEDTVDIN